MTNVIKNWRENRNLNHRIGIKGKIISYTQIFGTNSSDNNPYFVAFVKLNNGIFSTLSIVSESTDIKIGDKVVLVLRRIKDPSRESIVEYGIKAKKI